MNGKQATTTPKTNTSDAKKKNEEEQGWMGERQTGNSNSKEQETRLVQKKEKEQGEG